MLENNIDKDIDNLLEALVTRKQNRMSPTKRVNPAAVNNAANAVKESLFSPKILFSLFKTILSIKDLPDPGPPKIEIVLGIKLLLFR